MEANVQVVLAGGEADIAEEAQFAYLNTLGFVRTITAQEQWYVLVNDAYHAAKLPINEPVRDYLGFMLHRYMSLYHDLARDTQGKDDWFSRAYQEMAKSFGQATMVLRSVCPRFVHRRAVEKEAREAHFFPHVRDRINAAQLVLMHYKPHRSGHV